MIRKKVLFEEIKVQAKGTADSLREKNSEVDTTENGQEALLKYEKNQYPIVITNIEMPVMGGEEFIRRLNTNQFPPIIFVQAVHYYPELIAHSIKNPICDYLKKPLQIDDLVIKFNNAFKRAELRRAKLLAKGIQSGDRHRRFGYLSRNAYIRNNYNFSRCANQIINF